MQRPEKPIFHIASRKEFGGAGERLIDQRYLKYVMLDVTQHPIAVKCNYLIRKRRMSFLRSYKIWCIPKQQMLGPAWQHRPGRHKLSSSLLSSLLREDCRFMATLISSLHNVWNTDPIGNICILTAFTVWGLTSLPAVRQNGCCSLSLCFFLSLACSTSSISPSLSDFIVPSARGFCMFEDSGNNEWSL